MRPPDEVRRYLADQLARDPFGEGPEILARRQAFLGLEDTGRESAGDEPEANAPKAVIAPEVGSPDRGEVQAALETVRAEFWNLDVDTVCRRLAALELEAFPDLEVTAARLRRVAALRERFWELERHRNAHPEFIKRFQAVVIARPREAARLRDEAAESFSVTMKRSRAKKAAETVGMEFSDLEALDPDWIDRICSLPGRTTERFEQAAKTSFPFFLFLWLLWIGIRGCIGATQ